METSTPLRNLMERTGYTETAVLRYLMGCYIGNGFIKLAKEVNIYAFYRYFVELIMDAHLPIRKAVSVCCEAVNESSVEPRMLGRNRGMQESMLQLGENFEHLIFPMDIPLQTIKLQGQGKIYASTAEFFSQQERIYPLNDGYLFFSEEPVSILIHTEISTGLRTVAQNAKVSEPAFVPVVSHHNIFNHVRFSGYSSNDNYIFYDLSDMTDESFVSILSTFINSRTKALRDEESRAEQSYVSQAYWAETVQEMITSLQFTASEKRGWTCIMRKFPHVRSVAQFEDLFKHCYDFQQACLLLKEVNLVSYPTADKILRFMVPKFKRRLF